MNSRNKNNSLHQHSFLNKNELTLKGNGTILKDNNSSIVLNESYAEDSENSLININSHGLLDSNKNNKNLILIQDLNTSNASNLRETYSRNSSVIKNKNEVI